MTFVENLLAGEALSWFYFLLASFGAIFFATVTIPIYLYRRTMSALNDLLVSVVAKLVKSRDEVSAKIGELLVKVAELEAAVAAGEPPAQETLDALALVAQELDDLVPDPVVEEEPVEEEPVEEVPVEEPVEEPSE